jgi:hypothetical protein
MTKIKKNAAEEKLCIFLSKIPIHELFSASVGHFCPPGSGSGSITLPFPIVISDLKLTKFAKNMANARKNTTEQTVVCKSGLKLKINCVKTF